MTVEHDRLFETTLFSSRQIKHKHTFRYSDDDCVAFRIACSCLKKQNTQFRCSASSYTASFYVQPHIPCPNQHLVCSIPKISLSIQLIPQLRNTSGICGTNATKSGYTIPHDVIVASVHRRKCLTVC